MKATKKIFAALIAVMMIVMMIPFTASAATAQNTLNWSCTKAGYTFSIYQVATLDKTTGKYNVTVSNSTLKSDIENELNKVDSKIETENAANLEYVGNGANATSVFKRLDSFFTDKTDAKIKAVLGDKIASFKTSATAVSGSVSLNDGLYYVVVLNGDHPANVKTRTGSVIALPYFSDADNAWVTSYDANFNAKVSDDTASVVKTIVPSKDYTTNTGNTAAITDETTPVIFKLTASIVGSEKQPVSFYAIGDNMSANLNYVSFISAKLVKNDGSASKDVTDNFTKVNGDFKGTEKAYTFYFRYDVTKAFEDDFYSYDKVEIQYNATVKDTVKVANAEDNTDYLVYSQNPQVNPDGTTPNPTPNPDGSEGTPVPPTPENFEDVDGTTVYVYTLGVDITKYDVNDKSKTPLKGAIFGLFTADGKTLLGLTTSTEDGKDKFYEVTNAEKYEYNTNDVYNVKPGSYVIKELVAPKGYSLNAAPISVEVTGTPSKSGVENSATNYSNGYFEYECGNSPLILPATGGAGTVMFTIVGASLIACAGLLLIAIKRRSSSK